jgi:hypothetical protein
VDRSWGYGSGETRESVRHGYDSILTAAYAFTDYRLQGQTIPLVLVDIASPPSGTLSLFNLYVALSRSSGRSTIRLLCDFDDKLFRCSHDVALMEEDDRLEELNYRTIVWWRRMMDLSESENQY